MTWPRSDIEDFVLIGLSVAAVIFGVFAGWWWIGVPGFGLIGGILGRRASQRRRRLRGR